MRVQLTFRKMHPTISIEEHVFREARKLDALSVDLVRWCHVVIDQPHRHRHGGRPVRVRVALQGAAGYIVANSESIIADTPENAHVAIDEAFQAVRSQLRTRVTSRTRGRGRGRGRHRRRAPHEATLQ
jgi:hypothetical protein